MPEIGPPTRRDLPCVRLKWRDLLRKFGGRLDHALAGYNAGEGTVESFQTGRALVLASGRMINRRGQVKGCMPPYRETQEYVKCAIVLLTNGQVKNAELAPFVI